MAASSPWFVIASSFLGQCSMASLRLAIKASLEQSQAVAASAASPEPEAPSKAIKQDKALPAAKSSPTAPQRKRGKEATTPVAPPPKRSKPKPRPKTQPGAGRARSRRPPAAAPAPRKRDKKLDAGRRPGRRALAADGEYYPAKVRAVNADGTIALDSRTATGGTTPRPASCGARDKRRPPRRTRTSRPRRL